MVIVELDHSRTDTSLQRLSLALEDRIAMLRLLSLSNAIRRTELHVFGRTFTSTTRVLAEAQAEASDEPAKKRFRGRNLYEFAQSLPENGLGFNIRPTSWREKPGCYYTLTDLRLKEFNGVGS